MAQQVVLSASGKLITPDGQAVDITVDDVTLDEVTVTKFGLGLTPVAAQSAYTQTYSTANKTVAAPTASTPAETAAAPAAMTAATISGGEDPTEAEYNLLLDDVTAVRAEVVKLVTDLAASNAEIVKLVADNLDLRQAITAIIDDLQAFGLVG